MNDKQLLRYARHIVMPEIAIAGQEKLLSNAVLIIGLGGIGSAASMYLASSGVGRLILLDFDTVSLSNLQRQIIHNTADIGCDKVSSAKDKLIKLNPDINIITHTKITDDKLLELVKSVDIVLDGTDNFNSRFLLNKICIKAKTPLVSAAVIGLVGQLATFRGYLKTKPCYRCLYDDTNATDDDTCVNNGVLAPLAGVLGTMGATLIVKNILNLGNILDEQLLLVDAKDMTTRIIKLPKDNNCPVCSLDN